MSKFNIVYKHRRGCLHSVILECPFDDLSAQDQIDFVQSLFLEANSKSKIIVILPLSSADVGRLGGADYGRA